MSEDIKFWAEYGLLIIFGSLALLMILGAIISVEYEMWLIRRKKKNKKK